MSKNDTNKDGNFIIDNSNNSTKFAFSMPPQPMLNFNNPDETLFMKKSLQAGAQVKNGLEMLLLQAFESYSIWTR